MSFRLVLLPAALVRNFLLLSMAVLCLTLLATSADAAVLHHLNAAPDQGNGATCVADCAALAIPSATPVVECGPSLCGLALPTLTINVSLLCSSDPALCRPPSGPCVSDPERCIAVICAANAPSCPTGSGPPPVFCLLNVTCPVGPPVVKFPFPQLPPPAKRTAADQKYQICGDQLGSLRRVTVGQIRRIHDGETVQLVPLCDTVNRTLTEQRQTYLARGNVQGLIPVIDSNDTLMSQLEDNGYEANDVIGIALARNTAILYVSRH